MFWKKREVINLRPVNNDDVLTNLQTEIDQKEKNIKENMEKLTNFFRKHHKILKDINIDNFDIEIELLLLKDVQVPHSWRETTFNESQFHLYITNDRFELIQTVKLENGEYERPKSISGDRRFNLLNNMRFTDLEKIFYKYDLGIGEILINALKKNEIRTLWSNLYLDKYNRTYSYRKKQLEQRTVELENTNKLTQLIE